MAQSKYEKLREVSELIITGIYKDSEKYVVLTFAKSGSTAKIFPGMELAFQDEQNGRYDFNFETDQSAAIGGHLCALIEDEDNTEDRCYRLYYSKDQYVLIKTSRACPGWITVKRNVAPNLTGVISWAPFRYIGTFDFRSEMLHEQDRSNELINSSCQEEFTSNGEASSTLTNSSNEESDDLEFLEKKLKEMRLQKLEKLNEAIDTRLNQINPLQQKIEELQREAEELQVTRKKVIRDLYPVVYRIKDTCCNYVSGYFSSYQNARDAIAKHGPLYCVIVTAVSDDMEEEFIDLLDKTPKLLKY